MTIFNAYQNPNTGEAACLPDRFNWFAFLLPAIWAISHRLWRELLVMVVSVILLAFATAAIDLPFWSLYLLGGLYFGFEAHVLHGRALLRRGWHHTGILNATDRIDAETEVDRRQFGQA